MQQYKQEFMANVAQNLNMSENFQVSALLLCCAERLAST